jgi:hypothetical protein
MFTTVCPGCEASLNAPDTLKGKKVKCKKCGEPFVAKPAGADDDDAPPRKTVKMKSVSPPPKSRKDHDEDAVTDESPSLKGRKSKKLDDVEDTEVMESMRDEDDDEDEPKPKKKGGGKKKSKKKEGSPMLLILIAVGAIVLLGGGGAAAFFIFFNDEDKPTTPAAKGGTTTPETPKQGGASAVASGWVEHVDADGKYRIKFPKTPEVMSLPVPKADGGVQQLKVTAAELRPEYFVSMHFPIPPELAGLPDDQLLKFFVDQFLTQGKGAVEKSRKPITYQGFPGTDAEVEEGAKKSSGTLRVIRAGSRVIMLAAGAEGSVPDAARAKAFFESLRIE